MSEDKKKVIRVSSEHITLGIKKYDGQQDTHILSLILAANLSYTPYRFNDGRILLVLPQNTGAFLYDSEETLFERLNLSS